MKETTFHLREHLLFALLTVLTLILCIGVGSVSVPFHDTAEIIFRAIAGWEQPSDRSQPTTSICHADSSAEGVRMAEISP